LEIISKNRNFTYFFLVPLYDYSECQQNPSGGHLKRAKASESKKKGAKRLSSALEEALEPESASRKTTPLSKRIPSLVIVALKY